MTRITTRLREIKWTCGLVIGALTTLAGCIDPYVVNVKAGGQGILVVDGFLADGDTTIIRLTRSRSLNDSTTTFDPENNARVSIAEIGSFSMQAHGDGHGNYTLPPVALRRDARYQLTVFTSDGTSYVSDAVGYLPTPVIDSISWKQGNLSGIDGVHVYANTHDDSGNTKYYRWTFEETWQYSPRYHSFYEMVDGAAQPRKNEQIFNCWKTLREPDVSIYSTKLQSRDQVTEFPLTFISQRSPRLMYRYSIFVHQFGLTEDAYNYWLQLKKNSESLGTVFGTLPSSVQGNLHVVENSELPVLGYFSAGTRESVRMTIEARKIFGVLHEYDDGYAGCYSEFISPLQPYTTDIILSDAIENMVRGWRVTTPYCGDCRLQGGVTTPPDWW